MATVKDFLNALVAVRDKHETVTVGWHSFSFDPSNGGAGCKITVRRPIPGEFLQPIDAIGFGGFAFRSNSIVTKARIFAHTDGEYDRLRAQHERIYLSEQIDSVDCHIRSELKSLNDRGRSEHHKATRANVARLEGIRDELLAKRETTAMKTRRAA